MVSAIFGIKPRTRQQRKFLRIFVLVKSLISLIIFVLALVFLYRLYRLGS